MNKHTIRSSAQGFGLLLVVILVAILGGVIIAGVIAHQAGEGVTLKLSNGCKDTDIAVSPLSLDNISSPVTIQAKLTMGSQPIVDERVTFRLIAKDTQGHNLQLLEGYGQTDASGVAKLQKSSGFSEDSITLGSKPTISGYSATFDGASAIKKNEPFYCHSTATAQLTVQKL